MRARSTRRELIAAATATAAAAAVPPAWGRQLLSRRAGIGQGRFLDGVASGEPGPHAVSFWSRLTTHRPRSGARLIVARDEDMRRVVAHAVVPTGRGINGTLKARIGGLQPSHEYFYVWESSDHVSEVGRTRTAPDPKSNRPLRLMFSSCQNYPQGWFSAHGQAAADDFDLCVFLGDYIYERRHSADEFDPRTDPIMANDLGSYRAKYKLYRADPGLRELHRVHPSVHIWDDHEIANNYSDNNPAPSPLQRSAGYRAAFEWLPRQAMASDRYRIYKRIRLGQTVDLFLLDERQYRTGDGDGQPRRILNDAQLQWLINGLRASRARWKIVANQVVIGSMVFGHAKSLDAWNGYPEQRAQLLGAIEQAAIPDVVFMSGDIHAFLVNKLASDSTVFENDQAARPSAMEYVAGSITSQGTYRTEADVLSDNAWTMQWDAASHGYAAVIADPNVYVTEYRRADVSRPDGAVQAFERFTQPLGANVPTRETLAPPLPPPPAKT